MTTSHQLRRVSIATAVLAASIGAAQAQEAAQLERIEITGSAIKRSISDEGALPITVLKAEELRASGVTSVEAIVELLSSSQSSNTGANSIGSSTGGASYANLRGLGTNKTLVLLNGRRMTAFAFGANAVDLNSIPFAVIDRVEVLRDGASAVYGTDAIGGVINFITKSNFRGGQAVVELSDPKEKGGKKEGASLTFGFGDLEKDRVNIWGSLDKRRVDRIRALDRDFARTGIIPGKGVAGSSPTTFPGNFTQGNLSGNPTAPGCQGPLSVVNPTNNKVCIFDFSSTIDIAPDVDQTTLSGRATFKIADNHVLSLDAITTKNDNTARVAPDPVSAITIQPNNPFFPSSYPGIDPTKPISVGWRMVPAGPRTNGSHSTADRAVADLSGVVADWDYRAGVLYSKSTANDAAVNGYVNAPFVRAQVAAGNLNPFADATPAQLAIIEQAKRRGVFANATGETKGVDFRASKEIFDLPGGRAALAVAAEYRKEEYKSDTNDDVVLAIPSAGRSPNHVGGDRNVKAIGVELLLPLHKMVEVQLAVRRDDYSDAGATTNPKVGIRFQPMKELALRGSYNTGFRAPGLDDLYAPQTVTFSSGAKNDPLLCDGQGNPINGGVKSRDCQSQPQVQNGGNPNLKPEKSKTFTAGFVVEPITALTVSVDYWNIKLRDQINVLPIDVIFADPTRYAANIVRCNTLPAAVQANLQRCGGLDLNSNAIGYVIQTNDNIGRVKTDGIDFAAAYSMGLGGWGNLGLSYESTYVHSYEYQTNPSQKDYTQNVGVYKDGSPILRWKHTFSAAWAMNAWSSRLAIRHQSGYTDQNDPTTVVGGPSFYGNVATYTLVDLSGTYKFNKSTSVTLGVKNLFDTDPSFSNQSTRSQRGYDPRYSDPTGRAFFLRAAYGF